MATNFPNGISSMGVPMLGSGSQIPVTTGRYIWVSSVVGTSGNSGKTSKSAVDTIAHGLELATAAKGDVLIVMPGHAETISAAGGLNINKSGVQIIGLGKGALRPTLTLSAAAATITVTAANVTISNFILTANYADVAACFVVSAKDCVIDSCLFNESGTDLNWFSCILTSATDNAADGLTITNCREDSVDAATKAFISILANQDRVTITDNFVTQKSTIDAGHFIIASSKVLTNTIIARNILHVTGATTATVGIFMTGSGTGMTGVICNNYVASLDTTSELLLTATIDLQLFENYYTGNTNASGKLWPAVDAA